MTAYAIAHLTSVDMGPDIVRYLERIDATLAPFGGRFVVHGDRPDVRDGEFAGNVIVIEFPDRPSARIQFCDVDYSGGANRPSLREARENYRRLGASDPRRLELVRPPIAAEIP